VQFVDDGKKLQVVQLGLGEDETRDGLERFQQYGLTSVPLAGAEAVVLFVGGTRDHGLVVAVDDRRYRPTGLQPGEVAIYNSVGGRVLLKADGTLEVTGATKFSSTVEATGLKVSGKQVVGEQQATIAPPAAGGTVDANARTTIGQILTALQAHGLIA
jgi:phage baseplate assembly protein V